MPDKPINPLRQRLIDDMTARRYSEDTKRAVRPIYFGLPKPLSWAGTQSSRHSLQMVRNSVAACPCNATTPKFLDRLSARDSGS
jgi:hypothetical protein